MIRINSQSHNMKTAGAHAKPMRRGFDTAEEPQPKRRCRLAHLFNAARRLVIRQCNGPVAFLNRQFAQLTRRINAVE